MRIVLSIDGSTEMYDYVHVGYLLMALLVAWRTIASFITSAVESDPQYRLASKRSFFFTRDGLKMNSAKAKHQPVKRKSGRNRQLE